MKQFIVALIIAFAAIPMGVSARGEDLVNCRFSDGQRIPATLCDRFRQEDAAERKRSAIQAEQHRQWEKAQEERRIKRERESAELKQKWEEAEQERRQQQAERQAKSDAEYAKYEQEQARREKLAAEQTKVRKERCGADYGTPRIGMTIERAQDCVGKLKLVSQINRADGVVSTYRSGQTQVNVIAGKIVAWNRF